MHQIINGVRTKSVAVGSALMVGAGSVMAALPVDVGTAMDAAKADGIEMGTYVLVALAAIFVFALARRVLK